MIKNILNSFKNLEDITYKIMKKGISYCLVLSMISCLILLAYIFLFLSPTVYYMGFSLFRLSLYFTVEFIVCGFVVDNIKKQII